LSVIYVYHDEPRKICSKGIFIKDRPSRRIVGYKLSTNRN